MGRWDWWNDAAEADAVAHGADLDWEPEQPTSAELADIEEDMKRDSR